MELAAPHTSFIEDFSDAAKSSLTTAVDVAQIVSIVDQYEKKIEAVDKRIADIQTRRGEYAGKSKAGRFSPRSQAPAWERTALPAPPAT